MTEDGTHTIRTADQLLRLARDRIPDTLISHRQYDRMLRLSACIPAALVAAAGAECGLAADGGTADFGIAVSRYGFERLSDAEPPPFHPPLASPPADGVWRSIWSFGRRWAADANSHLFVRGLWLEFDTSREGQSGLPNVLISLDPQPSAALLATIANVLPDVGAKVAPTALQTLARFVSTVQEHLMLLHVGAMLARGEGGLRVCMHVIEPTGLEQILDATRCPHAAEELRLLYQSTAVADVTCVLLSFDVHDSIGPRVGVECFLQPKVPWETRGYRLMLDYLVERGLCHPDKRASILRMCAGRLPPIPSARLDRMLRCVSHFKIVAAPQEPRMAKVYFYAFALQKTLGLDGGY